MSKSDDVTTPGVGLDVLPDPWEQAGLIPPRRLGALLSESRTARGLTLADVAAASGGRFSFASLASIERGTTPLGDRDLAAVTRLYEVEAASLIPERSRLVVDLEEGRMWVAQTRHRSRLDHLTSGPGARNAEVLSRYLAMVYRMREVDPGTRITLRNEDLDVLGTALRLESDRLVADLEALMDDDDGSVSWRSRLLRRRVLVPAAGILVAVCGVGALVLVSGQDAGAAVASGVSPSTTSTSTTSTSTTSTAPSGAEAVQLGPSVFQERLPDGSPGPIVPR